MKAASILLAFVVVLGFVREAGAFTNLDARHDYTVRLGGQAFGLIEYNTNQSPISSRTTLCLGPLGHRDVPFTATQGLVGFCCILATLTVVPVVLTVRCKKKRVAQ